MLGGSFIHLLLGSGFVGWTDVRMCVHYSFLEFDHEDTVLLFSNIAISLRHESLLLSTIKFPFLSFILLFLRRSLLDSKPPSNQHRGSKYMLLDQTTA